MGSVLLVAVFIALQFIIVKANPDSKRLYDDLLSNYNRLIRPVGNNSDRLTVKMGLRLSQLIDVVSFCLTLFSFNLDAIDIGTN
jgi:nicotinic acetylcholine receptor, invertebrate